MKAETLGLLENYFLGVVTGLGVAGLVSSIYLKAMAELNYIGPAHEDYGWVTFVLGIKSFNYDFYQNVAGLSGFFMILSALAIFLGIVLEDLVVKGTRSKEHEHHNAEND